MSYLAVAAERKRGLRAEAVNSTTIFRLGNVAEAWESPKARVLSTRNVVLAKPARVNIKSTLKFLRYQATAKQQQPAMDHHQVVDL